MVESSQVSWNTSTGEWAAALQSWAPMLLAFSKAWCEATRHILAAPSLKESVADCLSGAATAVMHAVFVMCGHSCRLMSVASSQAVRTKFTRGFTKESSAMKRKAEASARADPDNEALESRASNYAMWHRHTLQASKRYLIT